MRNACISLSYKHRNLKSLGAILKYIFIFYFLTHYLYYDDTTLAHPAILNRKKNRPTLLHRGAICNKTAVRGGSRPPHPPYGAATAWGQLVTGEPVDSWQGRLSVMEYPLCLSSACL